MKIKQQKQFNQFYKLYSDGKSMTEIALLFQCTRQRVHQILHLSDSFQARVVPPAPPKKCVWCNRIFKKSKGYSSTKYCPKCKEEKKTYWCKKLRLKCCIKCGLSKYKACSNGLCKNCYHKTDIQKEKKRIRMRKKYESGALDEYIKKYHKTKKYKDYHREYAKEYYKTIIKSRKISDPEFLKKLKGQWKKNNFKYRNKKYGTTKN